MPQPGSTMEEGTIVQWRKREGDPVAKGDVLLEIETDKATVEIEAETDTVLRKILQPAGAVVPVHQPIALLGAADEPLDALLAELGLGTVSGDERAEAQAAVPPEAPRQKPEARSQPALAFASDAATPFLSPRARRLADLRGVPALALAGRGTGPEGRVVERDVIAYLESLPVPTVETAPSLAEPSRLTPRATPLAARMADDLGVRLDELAAGLPGSRVRSADVLRHAETTRPAAPTPTVPPTAPAPAPDYTALPLAGLRKRIAENIVKSAFVAPHVTLTLEVDMTAATEFRARLIPEVEKAYGTRLSFTDILIKAAARALDDHPMLNAALVGEEIRLYRSKNIGVAVALEEGLIVPVVKAVETKTLGAISAELKPLVERVRAGKAQPDDLAGGTFSITNLGTFGIDVFDPIIVPPQAAILGVGRIADKPVVMNKEIVVRSMMNLCLSFDHRILDGAPAARFLQRLKELLENPMLILI
jgi:pyruvate dehydrogenase E2 component (dihydrolipoamide acetyltransferase)